MNTKDEMGELFKDHLEKVLEQEGGKWQSRITILNNVNCHTF